MADIDFDELDKAVSSLMGKAPLANEQAGGGTDGEKPVTTINLSDDFKPGEDPNKQIEEAARRIGEETVPETGVGVTHDITPKVTPNPAASQPVPKTASGGRFMDVMHRSSDMKPAVKTPAVPEPVEEPQPTPEPKTYPVPPTPTETPVASEPAPEIPASVVEEIAGADTPAASLPTQADEPLPMSPFLPNAKVEKRPLGGAAPLGAVPSPFGDDKADGKESEPAVPTSPPASFPAETPAEPVVQPQLEDTDKKEEPFASSINSEPSEEKSDNEQLPADTEVAGMSSEEVELQKLESMDIQASAPGVEKDIASVESGDTEKLAGPAPWDKEHQVDRPAEAHESKDAKSPGIYNTDAIHQPLSHPAKQKSGWGVVIAIILVILVCAGLGIAAFFILGPGI